MERAKLALESFVMEPSLKAHFGQLALDRSHKNLCSTSHPDHHFVINAVVRCPAAPAACTTTPMPGWLRQCSTAPESLERYDRLDDRRPCRATPRSACLRHHWLRGKVDLVPPHAIHAEQGGPTRSVAIIVRSQRLGQGTVLQGRYDPKTNTRMKATADAVPTN